MHISNFIARLLVVGTDVGVGISGITLALSRIKMNIREKAKKPRQMLKNKITIFVSTIFLLCNENLKAFQRYC